jgi:RNA polymerase sigma-70 factor (ECF subfamily)
MDASAEFHQMATRHLDCLYSYGRVLTRNESEAEDLLQETLLRAFRGLASFDRDLNAKVWLLKIMKNAHIDRCRRKQARPVEEELPDEPRRTAGSALDRALSVTPLNTEEILLRRLAVEEVRDAIRQLPPIWREAVELRDIEGLSYQQIAQVIDRPIGTVMSRLFRGRNLLRSFLREPADHPLHRDRAAP